jgi:pyruvate dehydrogenase E1 component
MTPRFELPGAERLATLASLRDHVAKGALSMIDWANHKPENRGKAPKVGGHQASSMSSVDLLCALYLHAKQPEDRVAVKPHAAPVLYSLAHLMGVLPTQAMGRLREYKGPQPYPTKLKDPLFVDYTTSSEALGVAATIYDAYAAVHQNRGLRGLGGEPVRSVYWAIAGDGELTEGQCDESLYDAGRWRLDNLVWIIDLNRQSLDRVMDDWGRLEQWVEAKFRAQGFEVLNLRWGSRAEALFARPGGDALRAVLERLPDADFHPLLVCEPDAIAGRLEGCAQGREEKRGVTRALEGLDAATIRAAIGHLGGHDLHALCAAYRMAVETPGPVAIIAHTVKGYQTSAAGHPENHGAILPSEEVAAWGVDRGLPEGEPYPRPPAGTAAAHLLSVRAEALFGTPDHGYAPPPRPDAKQILRGVTLARRAQSSTGQAFQSLNLALLRTPLGPYLQFAAPDVGQTTHLGPVIKATGVFAPRELPDPFRWLRETQPLAFDWRPSPLGQFHALGIAEGNAMLWAYAYGRRKKKLEGKLPLLPVVTVYDKFFERAFNQLDYACYSDARFVAVGVPSGTGLSRETATHQSTQTLRMIMDLPGILAYEPGFAADLAAIYPWALGQLWDEDGGAVYLRLSTQPLEQPVELPADHAEAAIRGAYWLCGEDQRAPAPGKPTVVLVASGRKLAEAREAAQVLHAEDGVGSRILNVTSYEALWRDWDRYANDPDAWADPERSYTLHELFAETDINAPLLMLGDHVPSVAEWLPNALQRLRPARFLGPRKNGEAGDLGSIDHLHGMGVEDLVAAARAEIAWRRRDRLG